MTRTSREHVWWVWTRGNLSIALFALLLAMTPAMSIAHYSSDEESNESSGLRLTSRQNAQRWPFGIVPYRIDPSISATMTGDIQQAINIWNAQTAIRFIPIAQATTILGTPPAHTVRFVNGTTCQSHVGVQTTVSEQDITLNDDVCGNVSGPLHEMGHTLG